ncbi:hypothetical protein CLOSTHATH_03953 [Hungatella hathewayi DSM 13479]|uniref:Uncharacterized protein n=1 Tax=Hungatella hathewayi DSM 13479 TaxID=566550 RepID=D3AK10_9FIRM|nr:hypothetical protein CLOSTHATH_03953 [Hungatella hathewayi DSM 13479]
MQDGYLCCRKKRFYFIVKSGILILFYFFSALAESCSCSYGCLSGSSSG